MPRVPLRVPQNSDENNKTEEKGKFMEKNKIYLFANNNYKFKHKLVTTRYHNYMEMTMLNPNVKYVRRKEKDICWKTCSY